MKYSMTRYPHFRIKIWSVLDKAKAGTATQSDLLEAKRAMIMLCDWYPIMSRKNKMGLAKLWNSKWDEIETILFPPDGVCPGPHRDILFHLDADRLIDWRKVSF